MPYDYVPAAKGNMAHMETPEALSTSKVIRDSQFANDDLIPVRMGFRSRR